MEQSADISVRFRETGGKFRALHGLNNGPCCYGSLVDVSHYYKQLQVPLVRLHDPNWPHPREVDIHTVFPDWDRDPSDPSSYDFRRTDEYICSVLATGARILYRLGESIEHTATKYYVHPPADYEKWAQVCLGIVRHYNDGWADGMRDSVEYWEIWNEPDNSPAMWSGTPHQYYELYRVAATALKAFNPQLKVGGCAIAHVGSDFERGFLDYCEQHRLPLDFYSWHTYTDDPEVIVRNARRVRAQLNERGYEHTESHCNEWNYFDSDWKLIWQPGSEWVRKRMFDTQKGPVGSAFAAAVLLALQDAAVDQANYYDGQPTALFCGLFDYHGAPQKTFHAFAAFRRLLEFPARAECSVNGSARGVFAGAGLNEQGEAAVLVANYRGQTRRYLMEWAGLPADGSLICREYRVDEGHSLGLTDERPWEATDGSMEVLLPGDSVALWTLTLR